MSSTKIALFGGNRAALTVAGVLAEHGQSVLLVDSHADHIAQAEALGFATASLDYHDDAELQRIGLGDRLGTLFGLFPSDAENVFLAISARALAPELRIICMIHQLESAPKLLAAGANKIIDPYEISGRKIWRILRQPLLSEVIEHTLLGTHEVRVVEIEVPAGSFLDGRKLSEIDLRERFALVLLGVVDLELGEHFVFSSAGYNHRLDGGDVLVLIGLDEDIARFRATLATDAE